ncbi:MAG: hypothetical protein R2932_46290 [Caldilineaceae bacterium]
MRKQNRFVILATVLATLVLLTACVAPVAPSDGAATDSTSDTTADVATNIKVGLVTDVGRVNDRALINQHWDGVLQACAVLGLAEGEDCKYIETIKILPTMPITFNNSSKAVSM